MNCFWLSRHQTFDTSSNAFKAMSGACERINVSLDEKHRISAGAEQINIGSTANAALGHTNGRGGHAGTQVKGGFKRDVERFEIAVVDPDDLGAGIDGPAEFNLIMNFDKRGQAKRTGEFAEVAELVAAKHCGNEEYGIGMVGRGFEDLDSVEREILAQDRQVNRGASQREVIETALEIGLVGEDRKAHGATALIRASDRWGIEICSQESLTWRSFLDLGDDSGRMRKKRGAEIPARWPSGVGSALEFGGARKQLRHLEALVSDDFREDAGRGAWHDEKQPADAAELLIVTG